MSREHRKLRVFHDAQLGFLTADTARKLSVQAASVIKQLQRLGDEFEIRVTSDRGR
jgi:hypothetical protein